MPNNKNVDLISLKSRLKRINWTISSGKLTLIGHTIFDNERKRVIEQIRILEGGELKNEVQNEI